MFIISFLKTVPWAAILFDMYRHLSFVCNLSRTTRDFTGLFVVLPVFVVMTDIFRLQRVPRSLCKLIHHLQTPTATMDKQRCSVINQLALEYFPSLADGLFELRPKVKVSSWDSFVLDFTILLLILRGYLLENFLQTREDSNLFRIR